MPAKMNPFEVKTKPCRATAAGAVLKPSGGNCAVLPQFLYLKYSTRVR